MLRFSANERRANLRDNPRISWDPAAVSGEAFTPYLAPKFKLPRDAPVFAIGSCFATSVQFALWGQGVQVPSLIQEVPHPRWLFAPTDGAHDFAFHFLHRYDPASMLLELGNILEPQELSGEALLYEPIPGVVIDGHYAPHIPLATKADSIARRDYFRDRQSGLRDAAAVILTLGLTEGWFDLVDQLPLNRIDWQVLKSHHDRLQFRNLQHADVLALLGRIVALLRRHIPGVKVILTVSPVPLLATSMDQDVAVATTYSKATLVCAAQEAATADPDLAYFPSYEMVMLSRREAAWKPDGRHVREEMVQQIMTHFSDAYLA